MGFMSSRTALTCTMVTALLLSACGNDDKQASRAVEVNTLHIFFSEVEENASQTGKIYSFNPDNGSRTELASYSPGEGMIVTLDTDEEQLGIDMAAFVDGSDVRVLDYKKDASTRVVTIKTFSDDICGIYPAKIPAESWATGGSDYFREAIDDTALFVALKFNNSCHASDVKYQYLNFDLTRTDPLVNSRFSSGTRLNGQYLFDTSFRGYDPDTDENVAGRVIWVGYDKDTSSIVIETALGIRLAQASLQFVNDPPIIQSPSEGLVIIQAEGNMFKLSLESVSSLLDGTDQSSANNLLEDLLSVAATTYSLNDESMPLQLSAEESALSFSDDDALYHINLTSGIVTTLYALPATLERIEFVQTRSGPLFVLKELTTHSSMSLYNVEPSVSEVAIVPSADYINFRSETNNLFVNTFDASSIGSAVPDAANQWTAAKLRLSNIVTVYPNSQLAFLDGQAESDDEILILRSNETDTSGALPEPEVYLYDADSYDGFTVFTSEEADKKKSTRALFGQLNHDVKRVIGNRIGANFIINPRYAGFLVTDEISNYGYFIDPNQGSSFDAAREDPTLRRLNTADYDPAISYFAGFFADLADLFDFRTTP